MLEDDPAKIESANFILLVKLGSRAAIGYYPLRERGAANIRIREYQYREYRGPTVNIRPIVARIQCFHKNISEIFFCKYKGMGLDRN